MAQLKVCPSCLGSSSPPFEAEAVVGNMLREGANRSKWKQLIFAYPSLSSFCKLARAAFFVFLTFLPTSSAMTSPLLRT